MKYIKEMALFAGGFVIGGVVVIRKVIASETIRKVMTDQLAKKITDVLYDEPPFKTQTHLNYTSYYTNKGTKHRAYHFDDIVLANRKDAEQVLSQLSDVITTYGQASVADLYDLVGVINEFTDNCYGWTSSDSMYVIHIRDGYKLKLPKPSLLH